MIRLNLDPKPVAAGAIVTLTPEVSITSLGEVRLPRRRFQVRRAINLIGGQVQDYLVDAQGNGYPLETFGGRGVYQATSRNTGKPLTLNAAPARFRYVGDRLVLA